ncbi:MAG TPA: hypothetical protein VGZ27_20210 [Vicinamibacterales bacterium]|nr:hypothetical protein [Vicinamibacterales bacterium]
MPATPVTVSSEPSLMGNWASQSIAAPNPKSCSNFQWSVTSQTTASLSGTFSAVCAGGVTISGTASGQLVNTTTVPITVTGNASLPAFPSCPFSLSGTGTIEDSGNTLTVPYTGTTCLGPVSGTERLHRPQPATPVVIQAPVLVAPEPNAMVTTLQPQLAVTDAVRTGPAGAVTYLFEVATDAPFSNKIGSWMTAEQPGQTTFIVPQPLASNTVYYWHVQAHDPATAGPWSATQGFQTPAPAPPPPPAVLFDHAWTGTVELQLRALLASGLARPDGSNGQAVVDRLNAMGGIYAGAEFQPHHNGVGDPTYGFGWFYVSYVPVGAGTNLYQIIEFGTPPPGD